VSTEGINCAGVKWVIRLQLILLLMLFIAVLDFTVGSFVHTDHGQLYMFCLHCLIQYRTLPPWDMCHITIV